MMSPFPIVYIVAAVRTPVGTFQGPLSSASAIDLGSTAIAAALQRVPSIRPDDVQEVFLGNVLSANLGQHPSKQCATHAGLSPKTVCTSVNKVCSSGLKAITLGAQSIMLGHANVIVAGGVESMSNAPNYTPPPPPRKTKFIPKAGNDIAKVSSSTSGQQVINGVLKDGFRDAYGRQEHMGVKGEKCASSLKIGREEQDKWTTESYERVTRAQKEGWFDEEIIPVTVASQEGKSFLVVDRDDEPEKFQPSKITTLLPAFLPRGGTLTAANSSSLSDGAAVLILTSSLLPSSCQARPLARILSWADVSLDPSKFTIAPSQAVPLALARANLDIAAIDAFEINDAFAVGTLANIKLLGLDRAKVNVHGGSVALGHPLGASGARIVVTLLGVLKRLRGRYGVATICNGGGEGSAIVVENLVFDE